MPGRTFNTLMRRLSRAGFKAEFVRAAVLPDWWSDECADDESLLPDIEFRVARFLGNSIDTVRDAAATLGMPQYPQARLRNMAKIERARVGPAIHAALQIAHAACRNLKDASRPVVVPDDAGAWRTELMKAAAFPDLDHVVADLWAHGIPVLHVEVLPSPKFQGMACIIDGRPVVLLGHDGDVPARFAFVALHEAGHIGAGDCAEGGPVVDETEELDDSESERKADAFAFTVMNGRPRPYEVRAESWRSLAEAATKAEAKHGVDAAHLILCWARQGRDRDLEAHRALQALWKRAASAKRTLRRHLDANLDVAACSDTDRALLRCLFLDPERNAGTR